MSWSLLTRRFFFFFQAEDGIRDPLVTGVQTCALPIYTARPLAPVIPIAAPIPHVDWAAHRAVYRSDLIVREDAPYRTLEDTFGGRAGWKIGRASCRERV